MKGSALFARLPERFRWTVHNVIAHPLCELLWQLGLVELSTWVHDSTVPENGQGAP